MGYSQANWNAGDSMQAGRYHYCLEGWPVSSSLGLIIALISSPLVLSMPLLVIGGRLIRKVILSINMSYRNWMS